MKVALLSCSRSITTASGREGGAPPDAYVTVKLLEDGRKCGDARLPNVVEESDEHSGVRGGDAPLDAYVETE